MNCKLQALPGLQHPSAKGRLVVCMNCSPSGGIPLLVSFVRVSSASGIRVLRIEPGGEWVVGEGHSHSHLDSVHRPQLLERETIPVTLHCHHYRNDSASNLRLAARRDS